MTGLKKLGIGLAGAAMSIALMIGISAQQTSAVGETIAMDSATVAPGGSAAVDVNALSFDSPGLGAWSVDIQYDAAVVSADSCIAEQGGVCNPAFAAGVVRFTGASAGGLEGDTKLAGITFGCLAEGVTTLTVIIDVLADATVGDPQPLTAAIQNGTFACTTASATATSAPPTATPLPGGDTGDSCASFTYQEDAQAALDSDPTDPAGLDADGDGFACDSLPKRNPGVDCSDFDFQQEAQSVYNADTSDPFNLDSDDDGIACENLPSATGSGKGLPVAGTGPGGLDNSTIQIWLIAGLIGAGIAWLSTGAAGAGLAAITGSRRDKQDGPGRQQAPGPTSAGPFGSRDSAEVLTTPPLDASRSSSSLPRRRAMSWLIAARQELANKQLDSAPGSDLEPHR